MKILHVVTLISKDGAYGGPVSVARAQCEALARRGHEVELVAASPQREAGRITENGVEVSTFPVRYIHQSLGFAGAYSPKLASYLRTGNWDIAHIHLARDLVSLPAAHALNAKRIPVFLQPHGMIDRSVRRSAHIVDALLTGRIMARAQRVYALTSHEEAALRSLFRRVRVRRINNGIDIPSVVDESGRTREVIFIARLHERKRPMAFIELAEMLAPTHPDVTFRLLGPDEGEGPAVRRAIDASRYKDRISWDGPATPRDVREALRSAAVFVLPSVNEVFPMTLLEAFAEGTPVVATDSMGFAEQCVRYQSARITTPDPSSLAHEVSSILSNPAIGDSLRRAAAHHLHAELNIERVADQLLSDYVAAQVRLASER